ncbi:MAG: carbohydrate kinase [Chitinophagales bacterium]
MSNTKVICFGEVLFDLLPKGKVAGGAPMNVAIQLKNLGISSEIISRVGKDSYGDALVSFLQEKGLDTKTIQRDSVHHTGIVDVDMSDPTNVRYDILQPVAYDFIEIEWGLQALVQQAAIFVHGSLITRNETSKNTLLQLLEVAQTVIFDVNLRLPHYSKEVLQELMQEADIVKMNEKELETIAEWYDAYEDEQGAMQWLKEQFDWEGICVTKGEDGAVFLDDSGFYECAGIEVAVVDTIGSGDAFLAGFLSQKLAGKAPQQCLDFACAMGALVATYSGGTPKVTERMVKGMMK